MHARSSQKLRLANEDHLARVFGDDDALLVSAPRLGHGGLLQLDRTGLHAIDRYSCLGLALSHDGTRLARGFTSGRAARPDGDVVVYDDMGFREFRRVDGIGNAHDVAFDASGDIYVVNTAGNAVVRLRADGGVDDAWTGPPYFDGWHVNCITEVAGELYATAFTSTARASGWRHDPSPEGMLFRLSDGHVVARGLAKPHDPRRLDGRWLACASGTSELVAIDDDGTIVQRRRFENFTRGLHWNERFIFVGDSNPRGVTEAGQTSAIHVIDRATWEPIATFALPTPEIYALVHLPEGRERSARFDLTPLFSSFSAGARAHDDRRSATWPAMDFVRPDEQGAAFSYTLPAALPSDSHIGFDVTLENTTTRTLSSVGPVPAQIILQWHSADGTADVWSLFELSEPIAPATNAAIRVFVPTPQLPGRYILRLAITQFADAWTGVRIVTNNVFTDIRTDLPRVGIRAVLADAATARVPTCDAGARVLWSNDGVALDDGSARTTIDAVPTLGITVDDGVLYRIAHADPHGDMLIAYDGDGVVRAQARRSLDPAACDVYAHIAKASPPIVVTGALAAGLRRGFGTNGNRRREQLFVDRFTASERTPTHGLFPASRLLDASSLRGTIDGDTNVPVVAPGSTFTVRIIITNHADAFLVASGPHDVVVSYRWFASDGAMCGDDARNPRSALPSSIGPGTSLAAAVRVVAPEVAGRYRLVVSLLQETGSWFVDIDPRFAWSVETTVAAT